MESGYRATTPKNTDPRPRARAPRLFDIDAAAPVNAAGAEAETAAGVDVMVRAGVDVTVTPAETYVTASPVVVYVTGSSVGHAVTVSAPVFEAATGVVMVTVDDAGQLHPTVVVVKPGGQVDVSIGVVPVQVFVTVYTELVRPVGQTARYSVS